nr:RcnB family protein [Sphingomonas sp. IC-11]
MAAAALVPGVSLAQERGGGRQWGGAEQRHRQPGGGWQRSAPQGRAPERQVQGGAERNWQRTAPQDRGGWAQQRAVPGTEAGREFRQERREQRRDFAAERQRDRQALTSGAVTRETFRADRARDGEAFRRDRARDGEAFRRDRAQDRRDFTRERRNDAQGNWARSGADWNDHARWDSRGGDWGDQRRWYGRNDRGGWNRDWRRDSRYDWGRWRASNRNAFRLPRYYAPYGWNQGYRRFSVGAVLSSLLFAQSYWINDPWSYRLPETDGDLRWVRYYNDALLVDVYSGEVVDVINDIFW